MVYCIVASLRRPMGIVTVTSGLSMDCTGCAEYRPRCVVPLAVSTWEEDRNLSKIVDEAYARELEQVLSQHLADVACLLWRTPLQMSSDPVFLVDQLSSFRLHGCNPQVFHRRGCCWRRRGLLLHQQGADFHCTGGESCRLW